MVNKAAVVLLGGIVLVGVLAVGGVAALVLGVGGGDAAGTQTPVDSTPLPFTPTSAGATTDPPAAADTPTPTATAATATATETTARRTTVLPRRFDERRIEVLVGRYVNDRRAAAGLDPLALNGSLAGDVGTMARDHSVAMANEGELTHVIDGNASADRYEASDLFRACQWESGLRDSIVSPENNGPESSDNALEAVGFTVAGQPYDDGRFNADEADVARAVVSAWWADSTYERRLTLPEAGSLGVGVEVTQSGEVYVTANLCS